MAEAKETLVNWIVEYVKSKDAMVKQITAIKPNAQDCDVVVEGTLKNQFVVVQPTLAGVAELGAFKDKHLVLVTTNARENMEFLISNWEKFVQFPHLSVYFVNPNSAMDKRWVIFPATHDRITERRALRKGIESLFSTVDAWS